MSENDRSASAVHLPAATGAGPGAAMARFWEARGVPVFEAAGALWGRYSRLYHVSLPFEREIEPDGAELRRALRAARVVAARYPSRSGLGVESGVWTCAPRGYSLDALSKSHRRQVRRGLERCEIRPVGADELLEQGMELNRSALARQRRADPEMTEPARWRRFVAAVDACPEAAAFGAFVDGRLSAYQVICRDGAWIHLLFKASRAEELVHKTTHALEYSIVVGAASDPTIDGVTAGMVPLGEEPRDPYKEEMGYRVLRQRVAVEIHPSARPFLTSSVAVAALASLARARAGPGRWRVWAATARAARTSRREGPFRAHAQGRA